MPCVNRGKRDTKTRCGLAVIRTSFLFTTTRSSTACSRRNLRHSLPRVPTSSTVEKILRAGARAIRGSALQLDFHPLGRRAHFGIVVARLFHDLVNHHIGVVGIVVKQDELFSSTFHNNIDGFAPVAVSPAAAARFV